MEDPSPPPLPPISFLPPLLISASKQPRSIKFTIDNNKSDRKKYSVRGVRKAQPKRSFSPPRLRHSWVYIVGNIFQDSDCLSCGNNNNATRLCCAGCFLWHRMTGPYTARADSYFRPSFSPCSFNRIYVFISTFFAY